MGVYVKGMKKPKNCHECVFGKYEVCAINISIEKKDSITHSCPLVEVPPHGRLIDADELVKKICESKCQCDYEECRYKDAFGSFGCEGVRLLKNAPVFIESEGE